MYEKATQKQKEYALKISDYLNVDLPSSNSATEYKEFLKFYSPIYLSEVNSPTEKQIEMVEIISNTLGYPEPENFTKLAYKEYISNHIDELNYTQRIEINRNIETYLDNYIEKYNLNKNTFDEIRNLKRVSGIYIFWGATKPLYIGKSVDLSERIIESFKERKRNHYKLKIRYISYYPVENEADMHILEPMLINEHFPILNYEFKTKNSSKYTSGVDINILEKLPVEEIETEDE